MTAPATRSAEAHLRFIPATTEALNLQVAETAQVRGLALLTCAMCGGDETVCTGDLTRESSKPPADTETYTFTGTVRCLRASCGKTCSFLPRSS